MALASLTAGFAGCGSDPSPPAKVKITTYENFHQAARKANIACDVYTPGRGTGLSPTDQGAICVGEGGPNVLGDEPATYFVLWPSAQAARSYAFEAAQEAGDSGGSTSRRLVGDTWTAVGPVAQLRKLRAIAGGHIYDASHPIPASWAKYTQGATPTPAPTEPANPDNEGCLDNCEVTTEKILDDLSGIICDPGNGETLSDDLTTRDPFHTGAQTIRACTAGGSADLSANGVAHVFDSYNDMMRSAVPELRDHCPPGVSLYGQAASAGDPDGYGYLVLSVQHNPTTVQRLEEAGATKLCS